MKLASDKKKSMNGNDMLWLFCRKAHTLWRQKNGVLYGKILFLVALSSPHSVSLKPEQN